MKRAIVAVSIVAGCGGKAEPAEPLVGGTIGMAAGIGDCVDPAPATTRASVYGVDDTGRVLICRDGGEECRAIDIATGGMSEHYPKVSGAVYDRPGAVVEDDGQLLACWGQTSCLRRTPSAYEKWMQAEVADGKVAVLSSETDRRFITTMDQKLTTVLRFEVAPTATDLVWWDSRFLVHADVAGATHGYLYDAAGKPRGVVGKLGAGKPIDVGLGPVELAPAVWAFLARDATAVATHDLDKGDGARVELGATDQAPDAAGLGRAADGVLAVALGGTHYGDVLVVNVDARTVKRWPAKRCEP